jgi:hypothetical protein
VSKYSGWQEGLRTLEKRKLTMGKKLEASEKKIRVTLDMAPEFYKRLEALEKLVGADSKAGLIRDSLKLYELVARMTLNGATIKAVTESGEKPLVILDLYSPSADKSGKALAAVLE